MLHFKVFHLLFVISWMACLFYLPRVFVHYAEGKKNGEDVCRILIMAQKLYRFSLLTGFFALLFGSILALGYNIYGPWLAWKLFFVMLLLIYQGFCFREIFRLKKGIIRGSLFYRFLNEGILLILIPILYLVVFKPF